MAMRDLSRLRERYLRYKSPVRLGNLASDLLRLSQWVQMRRNDDEIVDLMRKIAWCMEWVGDGATAELADMQREICRWRRAWPVEPARSVLVLRATRMSERVLEMSGLVESRARA
jgi:hypothetical protein